MPTVSEGGSVLEIAMYELYDIVLEQVSWSGIWLVGVVVALMALFAVHTLTVWLSGDPGRAFHRAKTMATISSTAWNTGATGVNAVADAGNMILPAWNVLVEHTVQPLIWTALEVSSVVFFHQHYTGIISEDALPFEGHDCAVAASDYETASAKGLREQWCGDVTAYAEQLGVAQNSGSSVIDNGTTLLMNTPTARRLQSLVAIDRLSSGQSLIGTLPIQPLLDVVGDIAGLIIELVATAADALFDVFYTILGEIAVLVFNMIMTITQMAARVVLQVVQSGMLQSVLRMGVDILIVIVFHVALPLLFAVLDLFMCILNLVQPGTWGVQLQCSKLTQTRTNAYLAAAHESCGAVLGS